MPTLKEELIRKGLAPVRIPIEEKQDFNDYLDKEVVDDFSSRVHDFTSMIYRRQPKHSIVWAKGKDSKGKILWEGKMKLNEDSLGTLIARILVQTKGGTVDDICKVIKAAKPEMNVGYPEVGTYLSKMKLAGILTVEKFRKEGGRSGLTGMYKLINEEATPELIIAELRGFYTKRKGKKTEKKKPVISKAESIYDDQPIEGLDGKFYKKVREVVGNQVLEDIVKKIVVEVIGKVEFVIRFEK